MDSSGYISDKKNFEFIASQNFVGLFGGAIISESSSLCGVCDKSGVLRKKKSFAVILVVKLCVVTRIISTDALFYL